MIYSDYLTEKCSCGTIIRQCRCWSFDKNMKTTRVIENGCEICKKNSKHYDKTLGADIVNPPWGKPGQGAKM